MYPCIVVSYRGFISYDVARIPVTVTNQSDFDHAPVGGKLSAIADQARDMAVNAEVIKGTINEKNSSTLCVNAVSIVELNIDKQCE